MSSKPLITDAEYAAEVKSHSDYLNWIFGVTTFFLAVACLQFVTPWRPAVVCLGAVVPMYAYAFANLPMSLKVLRKLYAETRDPEVKQTITHLEKKFHGWRVIFTNSILWISLFFYLSVLFSFDALIQWIKA